MKKLIIILLLVLCSCHQINEGYIVEKEYIPESTESYTVYMYIGKMMYPQYRTRKVQEKHILTVSNGEITERFSVDLEVYEKTQVGDWIKFEP
jgi:hypothetical protein